jgi:hypothetical protein
VSLAHRPGGHPPRLPRAPLALGLLLLMAGCGQVLTESTADVAGVAGAGIAGAVTKDATAGAAIGLGVSSVANAGLQYAERRVHGAEQDRIAQAAGGLPQGAAGVWSVSHDVAIEPDEHGEVVVTRILAARPAGGIGFTCKEIVFSVDGDPTPGDHAAGDTANGAAATAGAGTGPARAFYTATICQDGTHWKWASAEPATARWGTLQ